MVLRSVLLLGMCTMAVARSLARSVDTAASLKKTSRFADMVDILEKTKSNGELMQVAPFKRCALVGSSDALNNRRHGADIDAHDTVIRVNRLPTAQFYEDFGKRTTVLFGNSYSATTGRVSIMGPRLMNCLEPRCYKTFDCTKGGPDCNFQAIVFKGKFLERGYANFKHYRGNWSHAPFPVAAQNQQVTQAILGVNSMLGHCNFTADGLFEPTTGFQAILTFAPLCDSLTLYGFTGAKAGDGHVLHERLHSFTAEHELMHLMQTRSLDLSKWPSVNQKTARFLTNLQANGMADIEVVSA